MSQQFYIENYEFVNQQQQGETLLTKLNNCGSKPILKVKEMIINKSYKVINARKCETKFGKRLVLDLEEYQLFMPSRFDRFTDEEALEEINQRENLHITNKGESGRTYNLEFSETANFSTYF